MALIVCTECNKDVSTNAKICPNCGNPIASKFFEKIKARGWLLFTALTFLVFMPFRYALNVYDFYLNINNFDAVYVNGWQIVFPGILIVKLLIVLYGMFAGVLLLRLKENAIFNSKRYLKLKLGFSVLEIFFLIAPKAQYATSMLTFKLLGSLSISAIYFLIFWLYLTRSKKVKYLFENT